MKNEESFLEQPDSNSDKSDGNLPTADATSQKSDNSDENFESLSVRQKREERILLLEEKDKKRTLNETDLRHLSSGYAVSRIQKTLDCKLTKDDTSNKTLYDAAISARPIQLRNVINSVNMMN